MDAVFLKLLNISIQAGWLVLAVLALRLVLGRTRVPKSVRVLMWGLVGLRLVLPFSVESVLSLVPSRETLSLSTVRYASSPSLTTGIPPLDRAVNPSFSRVFSPHPGDSVNPLHALTWAAGWVWLAGFLVMAGYFVLSALLLRRRVRGAAETEKGVRESAAVPSPFVFGVFRPVIYLPDGLDPSVREYVLAHERAHIGRRDHLIKPLAFLLLAVYWFNPLLWLAYGLLSRDIELACDEKVLSQLGPDAKKPYSQALLAAVTFHRHVAACPVAFGEGRLTGRVKNILSWKKPALWITLASLLVCAVLAVCFLTDPARDEKAPEPAEEPVSELFGSYKFAGDLPDRFGPNIFTVRLYEDHTFQYYETIYSSHIGMGTWTYSDGVVTLTEKRQHLVGGTVVEVSEGVLQNVGGTMEDYEAYIRLRVTQEGLVYLSDGSDNFYYIGVRDGDPFLREAEAPDAEVRIG